MKNKENRLKFLLREDTKDQEDKGKIKRRLREEKNG